MPVKLNSSGGGSVTLTAPSTATDYTLTIPAATDTVAAIAATQTLTNKTLTSPTITGASISSMSSSVITSGTSQNSTSGTNIDFSSIPSWVKRITVMFNGVSISAAGIPALRLGTASGVETTGYFSIAEGINTAGTTSAVASSTTFLNIINLAAGTDLFYGSVILTTMGSNIWTMMGSLGRSGSTDAMYSCTGAKTLADILTTVRITTVGGQSFDAGSINILYE